MNCKELYEGLGHIAVHTRDMAESIRFYERIGGTLQKKETSFCAWWTSPGPRWS